MEKVEIPIVGLRKMVVLHDKKSRFMDSPMTFDSIEAAKREFVHAAKYSKDTKGRTPLFVDYPSDFELLHVADYNFLTGDVIPVEHIAIQVSDILSVEGEVR